MSHPNDDYMRRALMKEYECDNDNHDIGCQCPGRTPDFTHLLLRDLMGYLTGRGLSEAEATKQSAKLMDLIRESSG